MKKFFFFKQVLRTGGFVKDCINTILKSSDSKEELVKNLEIIHSKVCRLGYVGLLLSRN